MPVMLTYFEGNELKPVLPSYPDYDHLMSHVANQLDNNDMQLYRTPVVLTLQGEFEDEELNKLYGSSDGGDDLIACCYAAILYNGGTELLSKDRVRSVEYASKSIHWLQQQALNPNNNATFDIKLRTRFGIVFTPAVSPSINYDSKAVTGMVGLENLGATCYLNALLQVSWISYH
jgi:hypothetical protein